MKKPHYTHKEYILDVLEEEQNRLMNFLSRVIPVKYRYHFNRLIEVIVEINELSK